MRTFVLSLLTVAFSSGMYAQLCSNRTMNGSWALSGEGNIVRPEGTPITGPFGRAGVFTADNGKLHFKTVASYNGIPIQEEFDGTYSVKPDCTVDYAISVPLPTGEVIPGQFVGYLNDEGRQTTFMLVNPPGTTIAAVGYRQSPNVCRSAQFRGGWGVSLSGYFSGVPYRRVGTLAADAAGNFVLNSVVSYPGNGTAGEIRSESLSGTYSMGDQCTVTLKVTVALTGDARSGYVTSPASMTLFGALYGDRQLGTFVQIFDAPHPGTVITGTIER